MSRVCEPAVANPASPEPAAADRGQRVRRAGRLGGLARRAGGAGARGVRRGRWRAAGGRAVVLPPDDVDADVVAVLDGLLLAGGADVGPARYGSRPRPRTEDRPDRDAGELTVLAAALAAEPAGARACAGACSCSRSRTAARCTSTCPTWWATRRTARRPGVYGAHAVRFAPGEPGRRGAGRGRPGQLATTTRRSPIRAGSRSTGWAGDGVVEAVEDPALPFVLGVQWHPENEIGSRARSRRWWRPPAGGCD